MLCLLVLVLSASLVSVTNHADGATGASSKRKKAAKAPRSLTTADRADPSIARIPGGFVVLSTGARVPRATSANGLHFKDAGTALIRRPRWAKGGDMWASDMAQHRGRWLLYFAASVPGMKPSSHCIGVAESPTATGAFVPNDERPLVCPPGNNVPEAEDQFVDIARPTPVPTTPPVNPSASGDPSPSATPTAPALPPLPPNPANAHGAIDPSFTVIDGRPYLLYKTDGKPSSLRVLPLSADGRHAAGKSRQLLRSPGVVENPVLTRRGKYWYLFTSEGDYGGCRYRTVWRRALTPLGNWGAATPHVMLSLARQGLCGPGGADIVLRGKRQLLYFHAWTCRGTRRACVAPLRAYSSREDFRRPTRALYGLRLGFTKRGFPTIDKWLTVRR